MTGDTLQFRLAESADAPAVLEIKRAAIRAGASGTYDDDQIAAWAPDDEDVAVFEQAIASDRFTVLLAQAGEQTAGYGVLNGPDERIDAAYVHPEYTRGGIASSLVKQLEMRARMRSITKLEVVASLNAKPFYESLGYWHFDTETKTIDGVDVDFAVMEKRLDAG